MGGNNDLDRHGLPQRPDPFTGLPRPPQAPMRGARTRDWERDDALANAPDPPPGEGPVLAWYRGSWLVVAMYGGIGLAVNLLVLWAAEGFNFRWLGQWWAWPAVAVIVSFAAMAGLAQRTGLQCWAGAEWAATRRGWVRTYELTEIEIRPARQYTYLSLRDQDGRHAAFLLSSVLRDGLLWDLVYNGILHSVVESGAYVDTGTRERLRLPTEDDRADAD